MPETLASAWKDARLRRFLLVGQIVPLLITATAVTLMLLWLPDLPDPAAIRWQDGIPDGYGPGWTYAVLVAALGIGFPVLMTVPLLAGLRRGDRRFVVRLLGSLALAITVMLALSLTWLVAMQRGIPNAADAPGVATPLLVGTGVGVLAGVLGWIAQPPAPAPAVTVGRAATPAALASGQSVRWMRTTTASGRGIALILTAVVLLAGVAVSSWILALGAVWITLIVTVVVLVLAGTILAFRVRVDESGLAVRSILGVPRFRIPLADIDAAEAVEVRALADFGGIGIRSGRTGGFGVVLRSGDALKIRRRDGRFFIVTIQDAAMAASLLMALADRAVRPGASDA